MRNFWTIVCAPTSFNTTLVQLKGAEIEQLVKSAARFQYHTGSIKSWRASKTRCTVWTGFNTTLVQLKGLDHSSLRCLRGTFNTTLVQLKVKRILLYKETLDQSFNTTLVQLKAVVTVGHGPERRQVSIPHWFN